MELFLFFLGVLTTLAIIAIIKRYNSRSRVKNVVINQSSMFLLIKNFMPESLFDISHKDTQALVYEDTRLFK
jgi:hypothetical protein